MHSVPDAEAVRRFPLKPAQIVVGGFLAAITVGTVLLSLPIAKSGPGGATLLEAVFTATSAVCVTGHIVVDTPTYWTGFGQTVILVLVQLGGFGVMAFATVVGLAVVRRLRLRTRLTATTEFRAAGIADIRRLLLTVAGMSLGIEAVVAVLLTARFALGYGESLPRALWLGVFHAASSFNNAGFSLFSDSLMRFATDPWICLPIDAAIILGGLGFPVLLQLIAHRGKVLLWSMNTRIVLAATPVLLLAGTLLVTGFEWDNPGTLGPLDPGGKVLAGFTQSVFARTAGFNSVDVGSMSEASWVGLDVLMLIGGGPAGTAGGIKVTTFAVLFFILWTELRGEAAVNVFGKRLSRAVHRESITVVLMSVGVVIVATCLLLETTDFGTGRVLFEVVSAFGTVGMSTGITASLPPVDQVALMVLMFVGRLGPITLGSAIALRERHLVYELPKERPVIG